MKIPNTYTNHHHKHVDKAEAHTDVCACVLECMRASLYATHYVR